MATLDHLHGDLSGLYKVGVETIGKFVDLSSALGGMRAGKTYSGGDL